MATFEPIRYETEELLRIPTPSGGNKCYVVSGFADFTWAEGGLGGPLSMVGGSDDDDEKWVTHNLNILVRQQWQTVIDVSPTAAIAGYWFYDSDETDSTGIELESCKWDTVGVPEKPNVERIRLKIKLRMCGGTQSVVSKISYHLTTVVRDTAS